MSGLRGLWLGLPVGMDGIKSPAGASVVGYDDTTLQAIADNARALANYEALRNFSGRATGIKITDIATGGLFQRDDADTATPDNGATVLVDKLGRRWKRLVYGTSSSSFASLTGDPSENASLALTLSKKQNLIAFNNSSTAFLAGDGVFRVPVSVGSGGSGAAVFGAIAGNIDDQENLKFALQEKEPRLPSNGTTAHYLRGDRTFSLLNAAAVGLGNVTNTSDANKPVSAPMLAALNLKANANNAALTGVPTAPTAALGSSTTQIANMEALSAAVSSIAQGTFANETAAMALVIATSAYARTETLQLKAG